MIILDNSVLINDDCLKALKDIESNSIDSMVTDPPAGISFMGKEWDGDKGGRDAWVAWMREVMQECLRVLKPGAHAFVWAIPRTSHWTATALEDAGFEIRDVVTHLFGSGFPKSLDVSKAIDKAAGAEREVIGSHKKAGTMTSGWMHAGSNEVGIETEILHTIPATPEAKQWQGWGTALKPASEHWILCRKPLSEKTVAANVLTHGTGAINIDASRISNDKVEQSRWPANLVFSHNDDCIEECVENCAVVALDAQSVDSGGASRFFYVAKASRREKNAGCGGLEEKDANTCTGATRPNKPARLCADPHKKTAPVANHHPTVKSLKLMSYLITMITPPGGIVLDPFMGSGSTGIAANKDGFQFLGIEKEAEYFEIAKKRIENK